MKHRAGPPSKCHAEDTAPSEDLEALAKADARVLLTPLDEKHGNYIRKRGLDASEVQKIDAEAPICHKHEVTRYD